MLTEHEQYLESEATLHQVKERLTVGDKVYTLNEMNLVPAEVVKVSNRSVKVKVLSGRETDEIKNYPYTQIAKKGDCVAVVWETWRGNAMRGAYRIERTAFEQLRMPVEVIPKKLCVYEETFNFTPKVFHEKYLAQLKNYPEAAKAMELKLSESGNVGSGNRFKM